LKCRRCRWTKPFCSLANARNHAAPLSRRVATPRKNAETDTDIRELCRRLEGVPLAIELAASRSAAMTPREMIRPPERAISPAAKPRGRPAAAPARSACGD
jgi:hypothetical protein